MFVEHLLKNPGDKLVKWLAYEVFMMEEIYTSKKKKKFKKMIF